LSPLFRYNSRKIFKAGLPLKNMESTEQSSRRILMGLHPEHENNNGLNKLLTDVASIFGQPIIIRNFEEFIAHITNPAEKDCSRYLMEGNMGAPGSPEAHKGIQTYDLLKRRLGEPIARQKFSSITGQNTCYNSLRTAGVPAKMKPVSFKELKDFFTARVLILDDSKAHIKHTLFEKPIPELHLETVHSPELADKYVAEKGADFIVINGDYSFSPSEEPVQIARRLISNQFIYPGNIALVSQKPELLARAEEFGIPQFDSRGSFAPALRNRVYQRV
jgi:hypothetical protein